MRSNRGLRVQAATTSNLQMDIFSFAKARGAFGGTSVEGAAILAHDELNRSYYGIEATPSEIVVGQKVTNPGADALRAVLSRL